MVKLNGQAMDTQEMYGRLGIGKLEEYARITGLLGKDGSNIDATLLIRIMKESFGNAARALEVGCGYGRVGQEIIAAAGLSYFGIDMQKEFVEFFRARNADANIVQGNFLEHEWETSFDCVLFPWSVISDFSFGDGQIFALKKSRDLINPNGKILVDIPLDIVNKVQGYDPAPFRIHEQYNLGDFGLKYTGSYPYVTYTNRNRTVLELSRN